MRLKTKYFGEIDCPKEAKLHFLEGLFGFDEEKEFFLLPFEGGKGALLCFQSSATHGLGFVAINPFFLKSDYTPVLTHGELKAMGVERSEDLCFYVLCMMRHPVGDSTANLRCLVAVNDHTRRAMQVILEDGSYHMRHLLSELEQAEEGVLC